jgi:hypothetical protein
MYSKTRTEILMKQKILADETRAMVLRSVPFNYIMENNYLMNVVFSTE